MNYTKMLAVGIATIMALSPATAFAASIGSDVADGNTQTGETAETVIGSDPSRNAKTVYGVEEVGDESTSDFNVYAYKDQASEVLLPKTLIMDGASAKTNKCQYIVGVKGDIDGDRIINVVPDELIELSSRGKKDTAVAKLTQDKQSFVSNEIDSSSWVTTIGSIETDPSTTGITAGQWNGAFNFNISQSFNVSTTMLYVSPTGSDTEGDGSIDNPYATIYYANETITDNSEENPYTIKVADGTYTDLQEMYEGVNFDEWAASNDGWDFQGVICKDYVTYEGNSDNPEQCLIEFDGLANYNEADKIENNCLYKTPFHIGNNIHTTIKGFKIVAKNTRYALHAETAGLNGASHWSLEDCILEYHGTPDVIDVNKETFMAVIGTGSCLGETAVIKNCKLYNMDEAKETGSDTNPTANNLIYTVHDNNTHKENETSGMHLVFKDCYFYANTSRGDSVEIGLNCPNTNVEYTSDNHCDIVNCTSNKPVKVTKYLQDGEPNHWTHLTYNTEMTK